jgi:hypothetical protein
VLVVEAVDGTFVQFRDVAMSVISIIEGAVFEKTEGPTGRGILRAPASVPA